MTSHLIGALGPDMTSLPETTTSDIAMTTMSPERCRSEEDCKLFTVIVYVCIQGTMFVLGFIGNTLSFIVLQSDRKTHAATFLLQAMAVIDNLFLLSTGFAQTFTALTLFADQTNHWLSIYLQVFVWPLVHITQLCTVWITVLTAFNRFVAICYPYDADRVCSLKRVKLQVVVMVAVVLLYNSPRFFEYGFTCIEDRMMISDGLMIDEAYANRSTIAPYNITQPVYCIRMSCESAMKSTYWYPIIYENVLYCIVVFLLPLVLLIVFNVALVVELFRSHRDHQMTYSGRPSVTSENDERNERNNITLVMLVIIGVFLVTQTPAYINQLLYYFLAEEEYMCGHSYFYYYHVSNLIVSSNSCLNFVVYCACRQKFRDRLRDLRCFGKRCDYSNCVRQQRESVSTRSRSSGGNSIPVTYTPIQPTDVTRNCAVV